MKKERYVKPKIGQSVEAMYPLFPIMCEPPIPVVAARLFGVSFCLKGMVIKLLEGNEEDL